MTFLLTGAAMIATVALLISAAATASGATAADQNRRGPWGIAQWTSSRRRSLQPHERRWQTALISGKTNPSRWNSLVSELHALERLRGLRPTEPVPESHDAAWLEATISNLERTMTDPTPSGDKSL